MVATPPPQWFIEAIGSPGDRQTAAIDGCLIQYFGWGDPNQPAIVLVHGGAAHAGWWSHVAPLLAQQYRVLALDLSGHGDSGWRDSYSIRGFADEVMGVIEAERLQGPPVIVGHSMGGAVAIVVASLYGEKLAGAAIIDTPVRTPDPEPRPVRPARERPILPFYPTKEAIVARFRLVPQQPCEQTFILDHLARTSVRQTANGWTWKFDPNVFAQASAEPLHMHLERARCRLALFRGEGSTIVPPEVAAAMRNALGAAVPLVEIPQAHHHLMLDQPLAFVVAMRTLLAAWNH